MKIKISSRSGFSLVQISALLVVASLVMVTVLPTGRNTPDANRITTERMNELMRHFREYMVLNSGKLPCPADATLPTGSADYGRAAANGGSSTNCSGGTPAANYVDATNHVAIGMIPYKTLGIPKELTVDAWGRAITYAVDTNVTTTCWASPATGSIVVTDNGSAVHSIIALLSHGANGHGAFIPLAGTSGTGVRFNNNSSDTDELINAHVDASFAAISTLTAFTKKAPTATFDDLVAYNSPNWTMNAAPATASIAITSFPAPTTGFYSNVGHLLPSSAGATVTFSLTYGSAVTVTGTPRLALTATSVGGGGVALTNNGGSGAAAYANYASGSGTTTLNFTYPVLSTDVAPNGLSVTSPIDLNGGSISGCTTFTPPDLAGVVVPKVAVYTASGSFAVPADWNNTLNSIEAVGAGGNGAAGTVSAGGAGGGGGEYRKASNVAGLSGTIAVSVAGGGSGADTTFNTNTVVAKAGGNAAAATGGTGGNGGTGASGNYNGGTGGSVAGTSQSGGAGGGGAAGPSGVGKDGGASRDQAGSAGSGGGGSNGGSSAAGAQGTDVAHGDGGAGGAGADGTGGGAGSGGVTVGASADGTAGTAAKGDGGGGSGGSSVDSDTTGAGGAGGSGANWTATWQPVGAAATGNYGVGGGGGGSGGNSGATSLSGAGGAGGGYGAGGGGTGSATATPNAAYGAGSGGAVVITYR